MVLGGRYRSRARAESLETLVACSSEGTNGGSDGRLKKSSAGTPCSVRCIASSTRGPKKAERGRDVDGGQQILINCFHSLGSVSFIIVNRKGVIRSDQIGEHSSS